MSASTLTVRRVVSRYVDQVAESDLEAAAYGQPASSPAMAAAALSFLADRATEEFWAILLDAKHRVVATAHISTGTLSASLVHPREVFGPAVRLGAASIIVAHNHPSGDPEPSLEDRQITRRLIEAGVLLGIPLLDHVVLAGQPGSRAPRFVSLKERMDWSVSP